MYNTFMTFVSDDIKTKDFTHASLGLLSFGSDAQLDLAPKDGKTLPTVESVLRKMERIPGNRDLKTALDYIHNDVMSNPSYINQASKKLLVLFIGGRSLGWKNSYTDEFKNKFLNAGVSVIVVAGEGTGLDDLVTSPEMYITVEGDNVDGLNKVITKSVATLTGKRSLLIVFYWRMEISYSYQCLYIFYFYLIFIKLIFISYFSG